MSDDGTPDADVTDQPPTEEPAKDPLAELEKWKAAARKHEQRAKQNAAAAAELEQFKRQSMTDQEKLVAEAFEAGKKETLKETASKLVDAELRAAGKGRNVDVDALLEGLDRSRFVTDDGDADRKAIEEWFNRISPVSSEKPTWPDLGQGTRTEQPMALNGDPLLESLKTKLGLS